MTKKNRTLLVLQYIWEQSGEEHCISATSKTVNARGKRENYNIYAKTR